MSKLVLPLIVISVHFKPTLVSSVKIPKTLFSRLLKSYSAQLQSGLTVQLKECCWFDWITDVTLQTAGRGHRGKDGSRAEQEKGVGGPGEKYSDMIYRWCTLLSMSAQYETNENIREAQSRPCQHSGSWNQDTVWIRMGRVSTRVLPGVLFSGSEGREDGKTGSQREIRERSVERGWDRRGAIFLSEPTREVRTDCENILVIVGCLIKPLYQHWTRISCCIEGDYKFCFFWHLNMQEIKRARRK